MCKNMIFFWVGKIYFRFGGENDGDKITRGDDIGGNNGALWVGKMRGGK